MNVFLRITLVVCIVLMLPGASGVFGGSVDRSFTCSDSHAVIQYETTHQDHDSHAEDSQSSHSDCTQHAHCFQCHAAHGFLVVGAPTLMVPSIVFSVTVENIRKYQDIYLPGAIRPPIRFIS